ncbi:MAG TPA: UPF0182 family protein [Methanospirillum sp.]|nr:UPF0182 family protein [Methanospirillum sp.]
MRTGQYVALIPIGVILLFLTLTGVLGDLFWFDSIGYSTVYLTMLIMSTLLFLISGIIFFAFSYGNAIIAARIGGGRFGLDGNMLHLCGVVSGVAALIVGSSTIGSWEIILGYLNQTQFLIVDPIFGYDVSFYIFSLPFYTLLSRYLLILFIFTTILSFISFFSQRNGIQLDSEGNFTFTNSTGHFAFSWKDTIARFLPHLNILLFLIFATIALSLWLGRFSLLYTSNGTVFGAGYSEVTITIPVLTILSVLSLFIGLCFLLNERLQRPEVIAYGIVGFFSIAIIGIVAVFLMQTLVVQPNEFNLEKPFLEYNINSTLSGYNLTYADAREFPVSYNLSSSDIRNNSLTISNIRLWDWRPFKSTIEQLQLFRTYYAFNDVDLDRYWLNKTYKEVLISAREMNTNNLPQQAQTWVNEHLVYTHGYGAVMSPVDKVTANGLPEFYVKDIPPVSPYLNVDNPRIYYGEGKSPYIITNTNTDEFDYPAGDQNMYTIYDQTGGVLLSGLAKLVYAIQFGSVELLVSGSLTPDSRLHLNRNIVERAQIIAPFLTYDSDPYVVIADGKLFWIIDAYTTSDRYPYSEPFKSTSIPGVSMNYIRNSVKIVVDAYTGDVRYYITDPGDPIIRTYEKIFPNLFQTIDQMPGELRNHLRYPHGFFQVQAEVYATYHMKDPRVFYNREDAWVIPDEVYRGSRQQMEPYYVIMKLPGEEKEEFILMIPFTPRNKQNLIGWMAARCDPENYGDLIVYQFSKQELTYGPMQIEARIDQNPEISQSITLWSQAGSSVVRGNTLVIPIEQSLLYVEPLYLEATEKGTLPQLQRVIVSYSDKLTMQPTLNGAINEIFGDTMIQLDEKKREISPPLLDDTSILSQIAGLYTHAQTSLSSGRLGEYQQYVDQIGGLVSGYIKKT